MVLELVHYRGVLRITFLNLLLYLRCLLQVFNLCLIFLTLQLEVLDDLYEATIVCLQPLKLILNLPLGHLASSVRSLSSFKILVKVVLLFLVSEGGWFLLIINGVVLFMMAQCSGRLI